MTEDYRITTAGKIVAARDAFKQWVAEMQTTIGNATNEHLDVFANEHGDRVVSRWICRGTNKGMSVCPKTVRPFHFPASPSGTCEMADSRNVGSSAAPTSSIMKSKQNKGRNSTDLNLDREQVAQTNGNISARTLATPVRGSPLSPVRSSPLTLLS